MLNALNAHPLADSLAQAAVQPVTLNGQAGSRGQHLAEMLWTYVIDGQVTLGCGETIKPSPRDWISTAKWLFRQIDGQPPRQRREPIEPDLSDMVPEAEFADAEVKANEPEQQTSAGDEPYQSVSGSSTSAGEDDDIDDPDDPTDFDTEPSDSSTWMDYELQAQQIEAKLHGTPILTPAEVSEPPPPDPPPSYAYGSTPVTSLQPDGNAILIDRAEYEHRRQEGFLSGTRRRITFRCDDR